MRGKVISIINFKGGVGKTTLSVNLAACLAHEFNKISLLADLDPQSNSSIWLLGEARWRVINTAENIKRTGFSLFSKEMSNDYFISPYTDPKTDNWLPDLWLLPASFYMIKLEDKIFREQGMQKIAGRYKHFDEYQYLARHVDKLRKRFDFTIVDCPPNLYNVTRNALCHSDYILIPCTPDSLSTMGLRLLLHEMENVVDQPTKRKSLKRTPTVLGVVITRYRPQLKEHQQGVDTLASALDSFRTESSGLLVTGRTSLFEQHPIREYVAHSEAVQHGQPLCLYQPNSKAYSDVKAVTQAILDSMEDT